MELREFHDGSLAKGRGHILIFGLLGMMALFLSSTLFFDMYRGAAFGTMPIDNYIPYLLHLIGSDEGVVPGKPFVLRVFSVAVAVPFFDLLPLYKFTNLDASLSDTYLKGVQAFSFVSYLAAISTAIMLYLVTRVHCRGGRIEAIIVFLLSLQLVRHTNISTVDPIAIMVVSALLLSYRNKWVFPVLLMLSVGFNEKIVFLFFILTWGRFVFGFGRFEDKWQLIAANAAILIYFFIYNVWPSPPYEELTTVTGYPDAFVKALARDLTLKGVVLNVLPFLFLLVLAILACFGYHDFKRGSAFHYSDVLVLLGFFLICHLLSPVKYNVGRITMLVYPLYLPMAVMFLQRLIMSSSSSMSPKRN